MENREKIQREAESASNDPRVLESLKAATFSVVPADPSKGISDRSHSPSLAVFLLSPIARWLEHLQQYDFELSTGLDGIMAMQMPSLDDLVVTTFCEHCEQMENGVLY